MPRPNEIARWLREQHDKVKDLSAHLDRQVAAVPHHNVDQWLVNLTDEFERYRAHFEKHMALEQEGGYLAPVLEQRPTLAAEVTHLHAQHGQISQVMTWILSELNGLTSANRLLLRDACARIDTLIEIISEHEEQENLLVSQAFTEEVGTKD